VGSSIFFGGSVVAAVLAGAVALFAPCCVSVMLPAYFATAFQNRRRLVAMTFLFAAGVATVILPIALGAAAVQRLITSQHAAIYTTAGALMLVLAAYTLLGGRLHLPMPGRRAGGRTGPLSVYTLGIFSGVASSCCAPVLAGVLALSGVASSFGVAVGLGSAYVFGMVAPLFVMSLLWERFDWRSSRLFSPRSISYRLGPLRRTITPTALASGLLLVLMGAAVIWVGLASNAMPSPSGWQANVSSHLQHYGHQLTTALAWVPNWAAALIAAALVGLLARRALRELISSPEPEVRAVLPAEPLADVAEEEQSPTRGTAPSREYV
jgi:cytochrome c-type biogenesis protein